VSSGSGFQAGDDYFEAILLLLSRPRLVDEQALEQILPGSACNIDLSDVPKYQVLVTSPEVHFRVWSMPKPYLPPDVLKRVVASVKELRVKQALSSHVAFISVHAAEETPPQIRASTHLAIGKVAAALVDDSTLAMWDASANVIVAPSEQNLQDLAAGDWKSAFRLVGYDSIRQVRPSDINAEVEEARRRFPEFVEAFMRASGDDMFAVKCAFPHQKGVEHMWINVTVMEGERITGMLDSDPLDVPGLKAGAVVTKTLDELSDWLVIAGGQQLGGFTLKKVLGS
jgi:uncharacterized protein YegJ (DUF2314 family)